MLFSVVEEAMHRYCPNSLLDRDWATTLSHHCWRQCL